MKTSENGGELRSFFVLSPCRNRLSNFRLRPLYHKGKNLPVDYMERTTWCVQVLRSPKEAFAAAMQSWLERCKKCVRLQGDYVVKLVHFQLSVVSSFF